jgi:hypothetical protein
MDGSPVSGDRISGAMRRRLSGITAQLRFVFSRGSSAKINAPPVRICVLCLDTAALQDSCMCACGAYYHPGCFMTLRVCSRCGRDSREKMVLRASGWLPKFAEFGNLPEDGTFTSLHCMNCKTEVGAGDRFCAGCGYHLGTVTGFLCPVCSTEVEADSAFCSCCGATFGDGALTLVQCTYCQRLLEAGRLECACGMPMPPTCTNCGSPVDGELCCRDCNIRFEPEEG